MKTRVRNTSVESYYSIKDLSKRQMDVYQAIYLLGKACNMDISGWLGLPINSITPRTNELVAKGVVTESYRGKNPHTGKNVIYWTVKLLKPLQQSFL